jgi:lysophospholipase L1-like esterase
MGSRRRRDVLALGMVGGNSSSVPWYLSGGITLSNCVAVYQPVGAANLAASYINLVAPGTNNAAEGVAPIFSAETGWTFNGTTQYLKTGILPNANYSIYIETSRNLSVARANLIGETDNVVGGIGIESPGVTATKTRFVFGTVASAVEVTPNVVTGTLALTPSAQYINGAKVGTTAANWTGVTTKEIYIGAKNLNDTGILLPTSVRILRIAIYNIALTDAQVLALHASRLPNRFETVFFGDSITLGTGASDAAHQWTNLVIASKGYVNTINAGIGATILQNTVQNSVDTIGGAAVNNGRDTYSTRVLNHYPKRVFIHYGINDLRLNDVAITSANYGNDLGEIVDGIIAAGTSPQNIIIGSPSYCIPSEYSSFVSPFDGGSTEIHQSYVAQCAAIAAAKGTRYADVYQWMIDHGGDTLLPGTNTVHPNDAGHAAIANAFLSVL